MNIVKTRMTMTQATHALYQGFYKFSTPFEWLKKISMHRGFKIFALLFESWYLAHIHFTLYKFCIDVKGFSSIECLRFWSTCFKCTYFCLWDMPKMSWINLGIEFGRFAKIADHCINQLWLRTLAQEKRSLVKITSMNNSKIKRVHPIDVKH